MVLLGSLHLAKNYLVRMYNRILLEQIQSFLMYRLFLKFQKNQKFLRFRLLLAMLPIFHLLYKQF
jgi:hypothetical protein